jgi:hypothetical protein
MNPHSFCHRGDEFAMGFASAGAGMAGEGPARWCGSRDGAFRLGRRRPIGARYRGDRRWRLVGRWRLVDRRWRQLGAPGTGLARQGRDGEEVETGRFDSGVAVPSGRAIEATDVGWSTDVGFRSAYRGPATAAPDTRRMAWSTDVWAWSTDVGANHAYREACHAGPRDRRCQTRRTGGRPTLALRSRLSYGFGSKVRTLP